MYGDFDNLDDLDAMPRAGERKPLARQAMAACCEECVFNLDEMECSNPHHVNDPEDLDSKNPYAAACRDCTHKTRCLAKNPRRPPAKVEERREKWEAVRV